MYRKDFPMTSKYTFLDSASVSLKPKAMVNALVDFYTNKVVNPHSTDNPLGILTAQKFKDTRNRIAKLINCDPNEIIFTSGTTESSNIFIQSLFENIKIDDEIILFKDLHASAFLPILEANKKLHAKVHFIYKDEQLLKYISNKTKLVVVAEMNNTTGQIHDLKYLSEKIKKISPNCILVNDAAQAVAHKFVDFNYSDVLYFSASKMYGPTGLGCLVIKKKLRNFLSPTKFGGGASKNFDQFSWQPTSEIEFWEAGTPNTAGIFAFNATLKYLEKVDFKEIFKQEQKLGNYLRDQLMKIDGIQVFSNKDSPIVLFIIKDYSSQDVVSSLGHHKIITRAGFHCANLSSEIISYREGTIRVSLGMYNNKNDINKLLKFIKKGGFLDGII